MGSSHKKVEVGSLLYLKDLRTNKNRPYVCIHIFKNNARVAYDWLVVPITSKNKVGVNNLVEIHHPKLFKKSYAKLSNILSIPCSSEIKVSSTKFDGATVRDVISKLKSIF